MAKQNTTIHSGDSAVITVTMKDCDGANVDLSDMTVTYYVRPNPSATAVLSAVADVSSGLAEITLEPADTALVGSYFHELIATYGSAVVTGFTGYISFTYKALSATCTALEAIFDMDAFATALANSLIFSVDDNSMYIPIVAGGT